MALIREWGEQGHVIGNHTSTHRSLASAQVPLKDFIGDVVEADAVRQWMALNNSKAKQIQAAYIEHLGCC